MKNRPVLSPPGPPGRLLRTPRGMVLRRKPGRAPILRQPPPSGRAARWWRLAALLLALPMFGQTFQYLVDAPPLYLLSKSWPLITAPLAGWALFRLDVPYKRLIVFTLAWTLGVTPVIGIVQLGNGLGEAFATTAKAWSLMFPLSGAAALVLLRPAPRLLRRVLIGLGVALFAFLVVVWVVAPLSAYNLDAASTKLFMYDDERGCHLFMPMFFGLLLIFTLNRSFWIRPNLWKPLGIAICFWIMLAIYKERATIAAAALILVLGAALSLRRSRPAGFAVLAVGGFIGCVAVIYHLQSPALTQSLGGSLSVRRNSVMSALNFLSGDPLRWIIGVGATSRVGAQSLGEIVHNQMFFLADIGWLGVAFEYGLVGALLIALLHLAAVQVTARNAAPRDAVALALVDYVLFVLLTSPIYSVMFTPGEVTTCMALAWYLGYFRRYPAGRGPVGPDQKTLRPAMPITRVRSMMLRSRRKDQLAM